MESSRWFIEKLLYYHHHNVTKLGENISARPQSFQHLKDYNQNARCLLAIEIENEVSRKHLLGGAVNASALGRLGIVVGWTQKMVKALVRLREYWHFLASVGKKTFGTGNLLILSSQQLRDAIEFGQDSVL